jgi:pimeloyl-ACP methyl ester carboxylesterase
MSALLSWPVLASTIEAPKVTTDAAPAIPLEQVQSITQTWGFESGAEGWMPIQYNTAFPLAYWLKTPAVGPGDGVWYSPTQATNPGSPTSDYNSWVYIAYPYAVSVDAISVNQYNNSGGGLAGGATVKIYTSTNMSNWTQAASSPANLKAGVSAFNLPIDNRYIMVGLYTHRFAMSWYGYIDAVTFTNFITSPAVSLQVLDVNATPVSTLTLNSEGWPTPNPLTVTMTITNTTGMQLISPTLNLTFDSPSAPTDQGESRFYVLHTNGFGDEFYNSPLSGVQYSETVRLGPMSPGQRVITSALVWIQPSVTTTLAIAAKFYTNTIQVAPLGQDGKTVSIPQARIHPVIVMPGFLGTFPPLHDPLAQLDPFENVYQNLLAGLERAGYEWSWPGWGGTVSSFPYDWRRPVSVTGRITLKGDVEAIINTGALLRKPYVDYSQVDIVAHSMGGLVARAYVEDAGANNEQNVHKLITLATPHKGTLAAYRGWYGGDADGILQDPLFSGLLGALALCKLKKLPFASPVEEGKALTAENYYQYFRAEVFSAPDLLPPAGQVPPYLVSPGGSFYPYGIPPNPFLDDLNTTGGQFDVTKLQSFPITSSYSLAIPTEGEYRVDLPPNPVNPDAPELWLYGRRNANNVVNVGGDKVVPDFSSDLRLVVGYSNITGRNDSTPDIEHLTIPNHPVMVRKNIFYLTNITVPESFWITPHTSSLLEWDVLWAFVSCSPVRLLATDPQGRRAGLDLNTGQVINEIPGAFVGKDGDEPQLILLPNVTGQYQVQGKGITEGMYTIGALRLTKDSNPLVVRALTGTTTIGANYGFTVTALAKPIYMPIILKNSVGQMMAAPEIPEGTFNSPVPTPTPTPQPTITIESLMTTLDTAYQQGQINKESVYRDLSKTLNKAQKYLSEGKTDKAIKKLEEFVKEVEKQRGKHVTVEAADQLTTMTQQLIAQLRGQN